MIDIEIQLREYATQLLDQSPSEVSVEVADAIDVGSPGRSRWAASRRFALAGCAALLVLALIGTALAARTVARHPTNETAPAAASEAGVEAGTSTPATSVVPAGPNGENRPWNTKPLRLGIDLPDAHPVQASGGPWVPYPHPSTVDDSGVFQQHFAVGHGPVWKDGDPTGSVTVTSTTSHPIPTQGTTPIAADDSMPTTIINGHPAQIHLSDMGDAPRLVEWQDGKNQIRLVFAHLSLEEVLAIADGVRVRHTGGVDMPALPRGLVALDDGFRYSPVRGGESLIDYTFPGGKVRMNVRQGDRSELARTLDQWREVSELNESRVVRGHDAIINRNKPRMGTVVTWYEPDHDAVVTIQFIEGLDLRLDDILNHLVELDDKSFQNLQNLSQPNNTTSPSTNAAPPTAPH